MRSISRLFLFLVLALSVSSCRSDLDDTSATATTATVASATDPGSSGPVSTGTSTTFDTSTSAVDTDTGTTDASTGTGPALPDCHKPDETSRCFEPLDPCCDGCRPDCPPPPVGPAQTCVGPELCDEVRITSCAPGWFVEPRAIDDPTAARCFLAALRDRKIGSLRLQWLDPHGYGTDGSGYYDAEIWSRGDGSVLIVAAYRTFYGIGQGVDYYVSSTLPLRDVEWFTQCADADEAGMAACLVGTKDQSLTALPWLLAGCAEFVSC